MKKVLIITYYWPPSGGAGVQRWLRFAKHLRSFGWEPVIYTPENANYVLLDETLEKQVPEGLQILKYPITEPNNFLKPSKGGVKKDNTLYKIQQQKSENRSLLQKTSWFIRGNFFIPDARFLWIKPSIKYLSKILEKEKIDLIVSTGPPHSMHLIAKKLFQKFNIPWVADFRDPWTTMDYLDEMYLTSWAKKRHAKLERQVITGADKVVVVGRTMYNEFFENYSVKSEIIYNGYEQLPENNIKVPLDQKFSLVHIGNLSSVRNCPDLWTVLAELANENAAFKKHLEIKLVGTVDSQVIESIVSKGLGDLLNKIDYIPYDETQKHLNAAQVLLLPINRIPYAAFVLTGKLFEYLKSKRPVLLIGPSKGDAAEIIENCKAGFSCDFDDHAAMKKTVMQLFQKFLKGENQVDSVDTDLFSGFELTKRMASLFNELAEKK